MLAQRLQDVQTWLKERMKDTHHDFFNLPEHKLMSAYFLNRFMVAQSSMRLLHKFERLLKYAHKAEKVLPEMRKTGTKSVSLAVLATQLDEQVAMQLLADYPADTVLTDEIMRLTLIKLDQAEARYQQLALLDDLGIALDKYMRSFMMFTAFKMCKGIAQKYHFELMYDFIQDGFSAMKPLKSAESFIKTFTEKNAKLLKMYIQGIRIRLECDNVGT